MNRAIPSSWQYLRNSSLLRSRLRTWLMLLLTFKVPSHSYLQCLSLKVPWRLVSSFLLSSRRAVGFLEIRRSVGGPQLSHLRCRFSRKVRLWRKNALVASSSMSWVFFVCFCCCYHGFVCFETGSLQPWWPGICYVDQAAILIFS